MSSALPVTTLSRSGVSGALQAADATGHTMVNDGHSYVHVKNAGGTACNVSFAITQLVDGQTPPAKVVNVPITTGDKEIGPFPTQIYGVSLTITFDQVTSVTIGAFSLPSQ